MKRRSLTEICTPCRLSNQLIWCGGDIPEIGIKNGDNYTEVINLIIQSIQSAGGSIPQGTTNQILTWDTNNLPISSDLTEDMLPDTYVSQNRNSRLARS